jgi:WD40-like Beta Propeller Repeat
MKRRVSLTVFHAADGEVGGNSQADPHEGDHLGKQFCRIAGAAGYTCLLLVALALASVPPAGAQDLCDNQHISDWSAPVNLGPVVNSAGTEQGPAISKDELELYFVREVGGFGLGDLWVSTREDKEDPWGPPKNLGSTINTSARESTPALSRDGLRLYFTSAGHGGFGGFDIWVSERTHRRDPLGWGRGPDGLPIRPVNLGPGINTTGQEIGPAPFEDRKNNTLTLYFYAIRPGETLNRDLFTSTFDAEKGVFETAQPIVELNTLYDDEQPSIRRDGLEMFFVSNRPGGCGGSDIWVSTRASTSDSWSPPVNLGFPSIPHFSRHARLCPSTAGVSISSRTVPAVSEPPTCGSRRAPSSMTLTMVTTMTDLPRRRDDAELAARPEEGSA